MYNHVTVQKNESLDRLVSPTKIIEKYWRERGANKETIDIAGEVR
jgi:hypothetical protein